MDLQNLGYALTQVIHNFGAAGVVGGALAALWLAPRAELERRLCVLVCLGWAVQAASGATFGAISFYAYGRFPDIGGIAVAALAIKVVCAVAGFLLAALCFLRSGHWQAAGRRKAWQALAGLGATALTAAAFLRWFS